MSAPSPDELAVSNPVCTIQSNGQPLPTTIQVVSVDIWVGVDKLPKARIVVSDGSAADQNFPISETATLIPGAALTICLGYGSERTAVFSGLVYRQGLEVSINGPSRLVVEATDKAMAMTLSRSNAIFENVTDSQVCEKLITAASLHAEVTATSTVHAAIVQYYASDWDLLVLRAQASGMVVKAEAGTITVAPPDTGSSPVLTLTYGKSILDFRGDIDASTQYAPSAIQSLAWDAASQSLVKSSQPRTSVTTPGNLSSATLAKVFDVATSLRQTAGAMQAAELTQWSAAELLKCQLAKMRGEICFQGSALATPGCMVTLAGLGSRFNGNAYVSGVHHRWTEGLWRTTVEIGLSPRWFAASAPNIAAPGAAGQLPPANNLQSGTVLQINDDPDGEFRVLVNLPLLQAGVGQGLWARFGSFYASNSAGAFWYPEVGDEVVVGFLSGDPRYPVVLGSLYSKHNPPPSTPTAPNNLKQFMSRAKLHIDFQEDIPALRIVTPGKQSVVLDDAAKSITLTDMNGNTVTMNDSGITLKSATDLTLSAGGSINLTAQKGALKANGAESAQLSSNGIVQISGATVALNP